MAQKTAKTVEEVLHWIETTSHHQAAWRTKDNRDYARHDDPTAVMVLKGYHDTLRIPVAIQEKTRGLIQPGNRFDTRMYRATKAGRARLRRYLQTAAASTDGPDCPTCSEIGR